jgi:hypothetical protein
MGGGTPVFFKEGSTGSVSIIEGAIIVANLLMLHCIERSQKGDASSLSALQTRRACLARFLLSREGNNKNPLLSFNCRLDQ